MPSDHRLARSVLFTLGVLLAPALAALLPASASGDDAAFDRMVRQSAGHCIQAPSTSCAARLFDEVDADEDGRVDPSELKAVDQQLRVWTEVHGQELDAVDLKAVQLGFILVDAIGIERGVQLYDEDGDGALSFDEATADVDLDERPVPQLLQDRDFVNWQSLRRRFGAYAMLFDYLGIR